MSLATPDNGGLPAPLRPFDDLVRDFLSGKAEGTIRGYRRDLVTLGGFLGTSSLAATARRVLASHGDANRIVHSWRSSMVDAGYAPATINRRLAAVRSLVKLARLTGLVTWAIDVDGVTVEPFRDTRGGGWEQYQSAVEAASVRDRAILRLAGDRGLRRAEIASLDVGDLEDECRTVWVLGKGKKQKERMTLAEPTAEAIRAWLAERGGHRGALFPGKGKGARLSVSQVWRVCKRYGVRPHGLRHTAITRALEATNGNVRAVQRFARHAKVDTTLCYDDDRADVAGEVAAKMHGEVT